MTFKDQFVTGGEMWSFRCAVLGQCVYTQKKLAFGTVRVRAPLILQHTAFTLTL